MEKEKLEKLVASKELELVVLKLRLLKKKLLESKQEDVVFDDVEIMKQIITIWDKK